MRIVFTGGGTGGHVNPALNIASAVREIRPDAEISFIGTKRGIESTLVPKAGYAIDFVEVQGFRRSFSFKAIRQNCRAAYYAVESVHAAKKILRERKPDAVVGTGGYVSWPTVRAAAKLGIPCLIHEQNTYPGVTTRRLAKEASVICTSFEGSETYFTPAEQRKLILTGNPIHVDRITREEARRRLGLSEEEPYLLSFGGSMGAKRVNELCFDLMERFSVPRGIRHDHAIGRVEFSAFSALARQNGLDKKANLQLAEYFYDMPYRQAAADVIICRAGAMTLAELSVRGKAAIFIPSPHVAEDHQYKNARLLADAGAGMVFREEELTPELLCDTVEELLLNPNKRRRIEESIKKFAMPDSADRIAAEVVQLAEQGTAAP